MSQADEDSGNNSQQSQQSKLTKPSSLQHYFNKIENNPKLWQLQIKAKPNPNDKNTKFSYKTNYNKILGWGWVDNSKIKFQIKQGKTKVSFNTKPFSKEYRVDRDTRNRDKYDEKREEKEDREKKQLEGEDREGKQENQKGSRRESGDMDLSLSTSYDNSKLNIRLKDRGQIDIKFNQVMQIIPSKLKAQFEYLWQYKNNNETNKCFLQFLYTTGVNRWIIQQLFKGVHVEANQIQPCYRYRKNQTKFKVKFGTHSDTQVKVNSINHFGITKQIAENRLQNVQKISKDQDKDAEQSQSDPPTTQQNLNQLIKSRLQLQNKLTISKKSNNNEINFKTFLNYEFTPYKQSIRAQTLINQFGFHQFQTKYLNKYWKYYVFGCSLGTHWNSHTRIWSRKWEIVAEKSGFGRIGNVGVSLGDRGVGLRVLKKWGRNGKIEVMAMKKWKSGIRQVPALGIKININW